VYKRRTDKLFLNKHLVARRFALTQLLAQIDLFSGQNDLVCGGYDAPDQAGPDSNTCFRTYNDATISAVWYGMFQTE